jgi:hypothetical protein
MQRSVDGRLRDDNDGHASLLGHHLPHQSQLWCR